MCRVLIVEDYLDVRLLLARLFRARGCSVSEAGSVAEALGLIDPAPDCAVIDLDLPDGDGEEIVQALHDSAPNAHIVVHSAVADLGRIPDLRALGARVFTKPVSFDLIFEACHV